MKHKIVTLLFNFYPSFLESVNIFKKSYNLPFCIYMTHLLLGVLPQSPSPAVVIDNLKLCLPKKINPGEILNEYCQYW